MPRRNSSSPYTTQMTNDITMRILSVLIENPRPMTISEISNEDLLLRGVTSQKMARSLTKLCDAGLILKSKSKSKGRMVYIDADAFKKQGFDINQAVY